MIAPTTTSRHSRSRPPGEPRGFRLRGPPHARMERRREGARLGCCRRIYGVSKSRQHDLVRKILSDYFAGAQLAYLEGLAALTRALAG